METENPNLVFERTCTCANSIPGATNGSGTVTPTPLAAQIHLHQHRPNMVATPAEVSAACPPLQVKLLSDKGRAPTRGSEFAAGYDIYRYA